MADMYVLSAVYLPETTLLSLTLLRANRHCSFLPIKFLEIADICTTSHLPPEQNIFTCKGRYCRSFCITNSRQTNILAFHSIPHEYYILKTAHIQVSNFTFHRTKQTLQHFSLPNLKRQRQRTHSFIQIIIIFRQGSKSLRCQV